MKVQIIPNFEITKYIYNGDNFYLIEGELYYRDSYGLHFICGENEHVGKKVYTCEEYILEDPNCGIKALKNVEREQQNSTEEELAFRGIVDDVVEYGLMNDWDISRIIDIFKYMQLDMDMVKESIKNSEWYEDFEEYEW